MRHLSGFIIPAVSLALMVLTGCIGDYDIGEVAPPEHLDTETDHHYHDEHDHHGDDESCSECHDEADLTGSTMDEISEERQGGPSGHSHAAGVRNHGTQWFFNQPWAAPFIWGKLVRDGAIFLVLAAILFLATRRRSR